MDALLITDKGEMTVNLFTKEAPTTVENFIKLVEKGFYKDLIFHRAIPQFMIQGGCPEGTGNGTVGYTIACEVEGERQYHDRGVLSMAHAGKDTGSSQFFMCYNRHHTKHLDGHHTCFGKITKGIDNLDKLRKGDKFSIIMDNYGKK